MRGYLKQNCPVWSSKSDY